VIAVIDDAITFRARRDRRCLCHAEIAALVRGTIGRIDRGQD
jgi:hypothetical protein